MNISRQGDYVAFRSYEEFSRVLRASGFNRRLPRGFWDTVERQLTNVSTTAAVCRRINPYSPSTHLIAFTSDSPFSPSDQVNVMRTQDHEEATAVVTVMNSAIFLAQFFLLKEESTGRFIDIRLYDLEEMVLIPRRDAVRKLQPVYEKFAQVTFPALRTQLDANFAQRYEEFWQAQEVVTQSRLWSVLEQEIEPFSARLEFDREVCSALEVEISDDELLRLYHVIVREMIMTRHLTSD